MNNIFDFKDISDVKDKVIISNGGKRDDFKKKIIDLFTEAKKVGITEMHTDQVVISYYRKYVKNNESKPKTNMQVMNKLGILATKGELYRVRPGFYSLKD